MRRDNEAKPVYFQVTFFAINSIVRQSFNLYLKDRS